MAYFSNATDGMVFQDLVCTKCVHYDAEGCCPVLDLHMIYNGEKDQKPILDMLIEDSPKIATLPDCKMFWPTDQTVVNEANGQLRLDAGL